MFLESFRTRSASPARRFSAARATLPSRSLQE